jgi:DNA-binding response OmpR family regulator
LIRCIDYVTEARQEEFWRDRAEANGVDGYIKKPFDPKTFTAAIEQIVQRSKPLQPSD